MSVKLTKCCEKPVLSYDDVAVCKGCGDTNPATDWFDLSSGGEDDE